MKDIFVPLEIAEKLKEIGNKEGSGKWSCKKND